MEELLAGVEQHILDGGGEAVPIADLVDGRELEGDVGAVSSVGGDGLLQDVGRPLEKPTPAVDDDSSSLGQSRAVVGRLLEEPTPVIGDDGSSLGRSEGDVGGLLEEFAPIVLYPWPPARTAVDVSTHKSIETRTPSRKAPPPW
jgi:hypothetical protein